MIQHVAPVMHITTFVRNRNQNFTPGPAVIKLFSYLTHLSTKFILLINVKMPTIVGILTFISRINTTSERLKARNFFILRYFSFYEQLKFCGKWSLAWKKCITSGPEQSNWIFYFLAHQIRIFEIYPGIENLILPILSYPGRQVTSSCGITS